MSISNKRLAIIAVIMLGIALVGTLLLSGQDKPSSAVSPSPSATENSSVDIAKVEQLSKEFLSKYYNYTDPSNAAYLSSIKPYLTPSLAERVMEENRKLTDAKPIRCTTEKLEMNADGTDAATAEATLRCSEDGTSEPFTKTVALKWTLTDGRLQITEVELLSSTKKYPYLEQ